MKITPKENYLRLGRGEDPAYIPRFTMMGDDKVKTRFFQAWVKAMRRVHPEFGKGCYVDSTPLPNDAKDNPFNALCSHDLLQFIFMLKIPLLRCSPVRLYDLTLLHMP